jgi:hypothetical protein
MSELAAVDFKVRKAVLEADKALRALMGAVSPTAFNIALDKLDKGKILAARKKVLAFMDKFTPLTKLQFSAVYKALNPQSQAYVDWMDGVMGALWNLVGDLEKAAKLADKDPKKDLKILIETSVRYFKKTRSAPSGVGTLIKEIQKDFGPDAHGFSGVSILPALIMLFMIWETIVAGLKKRPKVDG